MNPYCTRNNGDCETCSLISYSCYCQNNPLHNGKRPGAGRSAILKEESIAKPSQSIGLTEVASYIIRDNQ